MASATATSAATPTYTKWKDKARARLEKRIAELEDTVVNGVKHEGEITLLEKKIELENWKNPSWYPPKKIGYVSGSSPDVDPPKKEGYLDWYWFVIGLYLLTIVAGLLYALSNSSTIQAFGGGIDLSVPLLILLPAHLIWSIRNIGIDVLAGVFFGGRPLYSPQSGYYIIPRGLLTLVTALVNYQDDRLPGPPDKIFRISIEEQEKRPEGDMPEEGFFRPIYVLTGAPDLSKEESKERIESGHFDALDSVRQTVDLEYSVRYRPHKKVGGIFRIVRNLSSITGDVDVRIRDLMREQTEKVLKEIFAGQTVATANDNLALVNKLFNLEVRLAVMRLGIDVDMGGGVVTINLSHKLNIAQMGVAAAGFKAESTIREARATNVKLTEEGTGAANARRSFLQAEAVGAQALKVATGMTTEQVAALEAAKQLGDKTVVLGGGGVSETVGLMTTLVNSLKPKGEASNG